jgi:hypothetical protein
MLSTKYSGVLKTEPEIAPFGFFWNHYILNTARSLDGFWSNVASDYLSIFTMSK